MLYNNDGGAHRNFLRNTPKGTRISFDGSGLSVFFP